MSIAEDFTTWMLNKPDPRFPEETRLDILAGWMETCTNLIKILNGVCEDNGVPPIINIADGDPFNEIETDLRKWADRLHNYQPKTLNSPDVVELASSLEGT